jgi:hypothetical protein
MRGYITGMSKFFSTEVDDGFRRHVYRPMQRLAVRCEECGHQATVSVEARNRDPRLVCRCGSREVTFDRLPRY